jgi:hypothetical protein
LNYLCVNLCCLANKIICTYAIKFSGCSFRTPFSTSSFSIAPVTVASYAIKFAVFVSPGASTEDNSEMSAG